LRYSPSTRSRRDLLENLGRAALALPFLGAFAGRARAAATGQAKNFLMITMPDGIEPSTFWPTGGERDFVLSPVLAPLERHRNKLLMVGPQLDPVTRQPLPGTGLAFKKTPGIHRAWLATTGHSIGAPRFQQTGDGLNVKTNHPSVDQLIAHHLKMAARAAGRPAPAFDSLELGVKAVGGDVPCIVNFTMDGAPMPRMMDDQVAWTRIFGATVPASPRDKLRRAAVSSFLHGRFATLAPGLGRDDRQLLDGHLQSLRELEARIASRESAPATCKLAEAMPIKPAGPAAPTDPQSVIPPLYANLQDTVALAFACDLTRVASISLSFEGGSGMAATWLGFKNEHHALSHHLKDPTQRERFNKGLNWAAGMVARMLDQLQKFPHPEGGTLYDQTLVWWMFRHGDGNAHANFGVPGILAGGAGGYFGTMGRYLSLPATSFTSLPFTMVNAMGISIDSFGVAENLVTAPLGALRS
jgi:hypothetical protein